MPGVADPLREARHDVRAAAQAVLGQLELIGLAWTSWDAEAQAAVLGELEEFVPRACRRGGALHPRGRLISRDRS